VTIDLAAQTVAAPGFEARFEIDTYTKWRLQNGLDDIGLTLQHTNQIETFELARPSYRPALS